MNEPATFAGDVRFLRAHGNDVIELRSPSGGCVAISPRYQARVMTSAVRRDGASLGYIDRGFVEAGKTGTVFDNYGGEDRFWLGPEAGRFGLYFQTGQPFTLAEWRVPRSLQEAPWTVVSSTERSVSFTCDMSLVSYSGARFELRVDRRVALIAEDTLGTRLGYGAVCGAPWVGFSTTNAITNVGRAAWTKDTGLLSIWILGMFVPAPDTKVVLPFDVAARGEVVNDGYFGKVPPDRLRVDAEAGVVIFAADGRYRSKVGLSPERARPFAGSYSPSKRLLTIIEIDPPGPRDDYVNSEWELQKDPYRGDVWNSYNDGPNELDPTAGAFYELESSSRAAPLGPGERLEHIHRTHHFVADPSALDPIARHAFGVGIAHLVGV